MKLKNKFIALATALAMFGASHNYVAADGCCPCPSAGCGYDDCCGSPYLAPAIALGAIAVVAIVAVAVQDHGHHHNHGHN